MNPKHTALLPFRKGFASQIEKTAGGFTWAVATEDHGARGPTLASGTCQTLREASQAAEAWLAVPWEASGRPPMLE